MTTRALLLTIALLTVAACDGSDPTGTVAPEVAMVELDPSQATLTVGDTLTLTARPRSATGQLLGDMVVTWSSQSTELVTVTPDGSTGRITAARAGNAVIRASAGGKTGEAVIAIVDPATPPPPPPPGAVVSVEIDVDSLAVAEGGTVQLTAIARDADGRVVTGRFVQWSSSDPEVALAGALGEVAGIRTGVATITARVDGAATAITARVWADYAYDLVYTGWNGADPATARLYATDLGDASRAAVRVGPDAPSGDAAPSPDGARLGYLLLLEGGVRAIMVARVDGTGAVELHRTTDIGCGGLAWSPDSQRLAFTCRIGDDDPDIWVVDADGGDLVNITDAHPGKQEGPSWSPRRPDGSHRIAYAQYVDGEPQVWTMRDDGTDPKRISTGIDWQPAWSPDGATIAFVRVGAAIYGDIWLVDADGGNERGLVRGQLAGPQWGPVWSPDGRFVAFHSGHETYGTGSPIDQVYTVWADGSKLARRTAGGMYAGAPAWRVQP